MHATRRNFLKTCATAAAAWLGTRLAGADDAPAAPPTKASRLVFVHGRAQQGKSSAMLQQEWLEAFDRGAAALGRTRPSAITLSFPFYGDALDGFTQKLELAVAEDVQARGSGTAKELLRFQAAFADEVQRRTGVTDEQVAAVYGGSVQERGPLNWKWVQAVLRTVDQHVPGANSVSLDAFTRDVYLYTRYPGVRDEVDRIVGAALDETPTTVVSHSLGTVVAYSVLRSDRRALHVPLFVTLGSPLAVRGVRDQYRPLRAPPPVGAWFNAFDRRDVVALYPLDPANFPVGLKIENHGDVANSTDNRHGIAGYLDDRAVVARILDSLA